MIISIINVYNIEPSLLTSIFAAILGCLVVFFVCIFGTYLYRKHTEKLKMQDEYTREEIEENKTEIKAKRHGKKANNN